MFYMIEMSALALALSINLGVTVQPVPGAPYQLAWLSDWQAQDLSSLGACLVPVSGNLFAL